MELRRMEDVMPATSATPTVWDQTILIPLQKNPLSLNGRMHWAKKAGLIKQWRTFVGWKAKRWPALGRCDVTLTWYVLDKRRRDEDNMYLLLKPMCDGLVDAGVVLDDIPALMGKKCRIELADKTVHSQAYMELRVTGR